MSYPGVAMILCSALVTGCVGGAGFGSSRAAPVLGGTVQVGVPAGYCVDPAAGTETEDGAIVIIGRCTDRAKVVPAIITVSIGSGGSGSVLTAGEEALVTYFTSDAGRASLSRQGKAEDISILRAYSDQGVFFLRLVDRVEGEYWRAIDAIGGRLVTMSVTGTPESPLAQDAGLEVLKKTLKAQGKAHPA